MNLFQGNKEDTEELLTDRYVEVNAKKISSHQRAVMETVPCVSWDHGLPGKHAQHPVVLKV